MSKSNDIRWPKKTILGALNGQISQVAVVKRDGEWVVKGKSCIIRRSEDGTWDIWICDPNDLNDRLHQRSVTNRVNKLRKYAEKGSLNEVDGEAWQTVRSIDFIVQDPSLCRLLGIRRKKQLTATQKNELVKRLAGHRKAKAA